MYFRILIAIWSLIATVAMVFLLAQLNNNNDFIYESDLALVDELGSARVELAKLKAQNQELIAALQDELDGFKVQTEEQLAATQASVSSVDTKLRSSVKNVQNSLEEKIEAQQVNQTEDIVAEWRPRVAQIACAALVGSGVGSVRQGTATLFERGGGFYLITNQHVIEGDRSAGCAYLLADQDEVQEINLESIDIPEPETDFAEIALGSEVEVLQSFAGNLGKMCSEQPAIGDGIVIIGYPSIGSVDDVTATEGIISGFDGDFFITSAKVERGNSGGAAIHVKNNCYLGIPTFVSYGELESLARILDISTVLQ